MPSPHVDDEKGKKAIVYKMKEGKRKGDEKKLWYIRRGKTEERGTGEKKKRKRKIRSLGYVRRGFIATYYSRILDLFYTKIQYFGLGSV